MSGETSVTNGSDEWDDDDGDNDNDYIGEDDDNDDDMMTTMTMTGWWQVADVRRDECDK